MPRINERLPAEHQLTYAGDVVATGHADEILDWAAAHDCDLHLVDTWVRASCVAPVERVVWLAVDR